jgi:hypothetical protein
VLDSKKKSQYFTFPTFLCSPIYRVNDRSIGLFLRYAFTSRYKEVLSKSHSSSTMTVPKFVPRLTKEEIRGKKASCVNTCRLAIVNKLPKETIFLQYTDRVVMF